MINNKEGEFNFVWLFAIVAGTAILILAIFGATKLIGTNYHYRDTEIAGELSVITDSLQAGFAGARKSVISFSKDTKLDINCGADSFGYNEIFVSVEKVNSKYNSVGSPVSTRNKYLFVSESSGRKYDVFSVPIEFAFRVADVIILNAGEYCFIGLDEDSEELSNIKMDLDMMKEKIQFGSSNCTEGSTKVCFGVGGNCDIFVRPGCTNSFICENEFDVGVVEKDGEQVTFIGNLLYPAIFSSKDIYECNLRRILYRQYVLSEIYLESINSMSSRGCSSSVYLDLVVLRDKSFELSIKVDRNDLIDLYFKSKEIKEGEERGQCRVWSG